MPTRDRRGRLRCRSSFLTSSRTERDHRQPPGVEALANLDEPQALHCPYPPQVEAAANIGLHHVLALVGVIAEARFLRGGKGTSVVILRIDAYG